MERRTRILLAVVLALVAGCGEGETAAPLAAAPAEPGDRGLQYSRDWVSPHQAVWRRVLAPLVGKPDLNYLEIGVWEGRSFIWMLDHVLTHPSARATGIDPFLGAEDHERIFRANVRKAGYQDRVTTLVGTSETMLRRLPLASFDLIYVDGSHKAGDVLLDAGVSWTLLKPGGILMFDDYGYPGPPDDGRQAPDELRPGRMLDAFLTANRNGLEVLHHGYQLIVRKTADPCARFFDCTPIGAYRYHWKDRRLVSSRSELPEILSPEETDALEGFLHTRGFGEVAYDFETGRAESAEFSLLADRLGLGRRAPEAAEAP